jgi:hypothetical protein
MAVVPATDSVGLPGLALLSMELTEERFRALARSSPWRWCSLQFVRTRRPERDRLAADVRAWLRRPGGLRVEDLDGRLLQAVWRPPHGPPRC